MEYDDICGAKDDIRISGIPRVRRERGDDCCFEGHQTTKETKKTGKGGEECRALLCPGSEP